ncbi:MAG TPA: TetR/AcrR family transcriptional regulator [Roseiarcus sp.]|nr:TetR/AcrR family transcriptional regulator [Roseiarcus sp.]
METFWKAGYAGTSLDDLAAATGMNRPSLYAAFGDKRSLYLKALRHYWRMSAAEMREVLTEVRSLREALNEFYRRAVAIYCGVQGRPRGCFSVSTAPAAALEDEEIRIALAESVRRLDERLEALIRAAQGRGEIAATADPAALALLGTATLHTLAIRARAGAAAEELEGMARKAVGAMCSVGGGTGLSS